MTDSQLEAIVDGFMKRFNNNGSVENGFVGFIHETKEDESFRIKQEQDAMIHLFSSFNEANVTAGCRLFAEHIYKEENSLKAKALLNHLEYLVKNNLLSSKPLCEALLNSPNLNYSNRDTWCSVFLLVRRIIGGVDYKGCRDIFRAILYKCRTIPSSDSTTPQILCVVEVFNYILNRNACLLPSYFAINEIIKLPQHDDRQPLHWAFGKILAEFTQTFRPTVQIVTISGLAHLRPIIGHSNINAYVWRLDLRNLRFPNNGPLPYDRDRSPTNLIRYLLTHAYSVDFMTSILIANRKSQDDGKHRYAELEDQLCDHVIHLTETQSKLSVCNAVLPNLRWHNITAQIIFFVLFTMVNFPHMLIQLYKKIEGRIPETGCARDHLMWMLMQCTFGAGKPLSAYEYISFMRLYDSLYPDTEPLPVPDVSSPHSVISNAVTCIWAHMQRKNLQHTDQKAKPRPIPTILRPQLEFLKSALPMYTQTPVPGSPLTCDFRLSALCNAYSTNDKVSPLLMSYITDSMMSTSAQTSLPHGVPCYMHTEPLTVEMLDSLSVHTKMLLIKQIFGKIDAQKGPSVQQVALSPALVETCARLLVYTEIEQTFGIKTFVTTVLPSVMSAKCSPVINALLEMATYRLAHIQPHHRMKILSSILEELGSAHQNQLFIRYENSAACLLLSLGNVEVQQQVYRSISEKKFSIVSHDSEELNKILVLTLARAVNAVSDSGQAGNWCLSLLRKVFEHTPHNWSAHTLETFPPLINEFYAQNHVQSEDKKQLLRNVEAEFKHWKTVTDAEASIAHFSRAGAERSLFLCVLWKCVMTNTPIRHTAYKVLEAIGPKSIGVHLRTFCDYIATQLHLNKEAFLQSTDALRSMMWKYHLFPLDRFLLCLSLRTFDAKDAQVCLFAIQKLLTTDKFMDMVKEFSSTAPAQHWKSCKSYESHMAYHTKYPESFLYEGILECNKMSAVSSNPNSQYLPSYFDNICLRILPVLDVVVHRLIEALKLGPTSEKPLLTILSDLSVLYKYHDQPVTYLYNTLHYYNKSLKERTEIKKRLVHGILGCGEKLPIDLVISADMKAYVLSNQTWEPKQDYYYRRVKRLVDVMAEERMEDLCDVDWRFAEFTSAPAHVLYSTCAEFLALPIAGEELGEKLIDVIFTWRHLIAKKAITSWMNAIALIITALPEPYWKVIFTRIIREFTDSDYLTGVDISSSNPFEVFDLTKSSLIEYRCSYILALTHVIWHHSSIGQLSLIPKFIKENVKPVVKTEQQFLFACHLIGPFLQRFQQERAYCCIELTIELYEILERVDKAGAELRYMDSICDFFYHIKYMYVGDEPKLEVEKVIKNLRTSLQLRLRFIAHHTTIDGGAIAPTPS